MTEYQQTTQSSNNFEQCVKCTVCTAFCPVTAVNPDYPGPKQAGPDGERYRLKKPLFYDEALKYCLNCKRCEVACPENVKIGDIIQAARIKYAKNPPSLRDMMLASTDLMGSMATLVSPIVNTTLRLKPVKAIMDSTLGISSHRTFPSYASEKFTTWFNRHARKSQEKFSKKVAYFHGCYANYNYPQLGKDLVKVMNALGYGVVLLEKEKCCGVAKIANRMIKEAIRDGEINLTSIRQAVEQGLPVLCTSSTCCFTIRDEYPHLLHLPNEDVRESVMLATRFIYSLIDRGEAQLKFKPGYKKKVWYHTPCHMEKLGWQIYSTTLMRMIPGLDFNVLESHCCGIAGTYGFKKENYGYSQAIGEPLFEQIKTENPDVVATDCETCKWQIEMSTGYPVMNPISILAEAIED